MHYKIAVSGLTEDKIVSAIVRGQLALHRSVDTSRAGMWTITHVPTGTVVLHFRSCRIARRAMRELQIFNWRFTRLRGAAFRAFAASVRATVTALREADNWRTMAKEHADAAT